MAGFKLFFFLLYAIQLVHGNTIILETESGPIRGKNVGKVDAFLGIPYAQPPIGQLRFAKPVPKEPWHEVYDGTSLPPPCIQVDFSHTFFGADVTNMSEDCLYLNVWVPLTNSKDELKTVMVFIHGGGFIVGSTNLDLYNGATLAEQGDVVVATINYRLGALGFLAGFTEDAPGSQGLYDQVLALQWIKDNAKHFNGDPDSIVLFGESAGAFSVSMHQVSPLSKNLFKRVILQSGAFISPINSMANEILYKQSNDFAKILGCKEAGMDLHDNPSAIFNCLKIVPAEKFPKIEMELLKKNSYSAFPRIGDDFLPDNTINLFRNGQFKDTEILMGITRDEGPLNLIFLQPHIFGKFGEQVVGDIFNETTAYYAIRGMMGNSDSAVEETIIRSYLNDVNVEKNYLDVVSEALGDYFITCWCIFQAKCQSMRDNHVYFYIFDHRTSNMPFAEWMGVPHFEEVQYVFGNPMYGTFTEQEVEISQDVINMWTTFAKTGNPNIPGSVTWPRYSYKDPKYLSIGKKDRVGTSPDQNRCERWRNRF